MDSSPPHPAELRAVAKGAVDLANNRYRGMRLGVDLLKPPALFPNMTGKNVRMVWTLDGPFATADYSYRLTSDFVQFDDNGFVGLRAEGRGRLTPGRCACRSGSRRKAITGIGDVAGAMLANPQIEGWLTVTPKLVQGEDLKLTSAKWNGKLSLLIDLVTGRFDVLLSGAMQRYLIPGLGIVDVMTDLHVVPGPTTRAAMSSAPPRPGCAGSTTVSSASLTGGLPSLTTNLERGNDGIVHLTNLQLYSPKLQAVGRRASASRTAPSISSRAGRQAKYGPLKMVLDGHIERPRARPLPRTARTRRSGSRDMRLLLDPTPAGYDYRASGGSRLGPFTSNGQILLPHDAPTVIAIAALDAGGAHASGDLRSDPGGFLGRLTLANGTLGGTLDFSPAGQAQRIDAHVTANNANFPDAFAVRTGRADGIIILADERTTIEGSRRCARHCGRAESRLRGSPPTPSWSTAPARSAPPSPGGAARTSLSRHSRTSRPTRSSLTGSGRIERQPLVLNQAAVLTRSGDGWALAPTSLSFAGGNGDRFGPKRLGARSARAAQRNAARRCSTSSGPTSTCRARRPAASIMPGRAIAAAGSILRSAASAAPAWCLRPSRSTSALRRLSTATRRRFARSPRATARSSAARRRASRRSATDR